jgi:hypothetical protein
MINIQQAVWWHAAVYSPTPDSPDFDPDATEGGMSSFRLTGEGASGVDPRYFTSTSPGVLAGRLCDALRSFTLIVSDSNGDGEPDTVVDNQSFGVRMGDPTLIGSRVIFNPTAAEAIAIFGQPRRVFALQDFANVRVPLSYMLMAVYNSGLSLQCTNRDLPDSWFSYNNIPGELADPVSAAELKTAMEPRPQRTADGMDAGFFVQFDQHPDVRRLGCCGVAVTPGTGGTGGNCPGGPSLRTWSGTPSRTRIWAVRSGLRGHVSSKILGGWDCPGPNPQELVYAEFDDDAKLFEQIDDAVITWHHAGFIVLEDNYPLVFPNDFCGTSSNNSPLLGNTYDYNKRLPVDIVDIAWDNRGWLWALCTGPSRTEGNLEEGNEVYVDGLYRMLPGGWSYQRADAISFGGHFQVDDAKPVTARLVQSRMGLFAKVACGDGYTLYLSSDGHFDFVSYTSSPEHTPPASVFDPTRVFTDISASSTHAACIDSDGLLQVWSMGEDGTHVPDDTLNMVKVACAKRMTAAIGVDGNIYAFGANFSPPSAANPIVPFTAVGCGSGHVAGLTGDGRLIVSGTYPDGSTADATFNGVSVFACGDDCTIYVQASSPHIIVYVGSGSSLINTPPVLNEGMEVVELSASERHAAALIRSLAEDAPTSAAVYTWGDTSPTQNGAPLTREGSPLVFDGQRDKFIHVSCGRRHTCLISDGALLEPRYSPARLVYRSRISLNSGVLVPDEPAAVITNSSDTGFPLDSSQAYDDSTILIGDSDGGDSPFDFAQKVGLKIYDADSSSVRVLGACWRPHRLMVDVNDSHKLEECGASVGSGSHLVLPPTHDLSISNMSADLPSGLTVREVGGTQGNFSQTQDWSALISYVSSDSKTNAGQAAAIPQLAPYATGSSGRWQLGALTYSSGAYRSASIMPYQSFNGGSDFFVPTACQVFMRQSGQVDDPQAPSIPAYRPNFETSNNLIPYDESSVGREYMLPPDGDVTREIRYLAPHWRLRAALPKCSIPADSASPTSTPFVEGAPGIEELPTDAEYVFQDNSMSSSGLTNYAMAVSPISAILVMWNRSNSFNNQWIVNGANVAQANNSASTNTVLSVICRQATGFSSAYSHTASNSSASTSPETFNSFITDVVDASQMSDGRMVCRSITVVYNVAQSGSQSGFVYSSGTSSSSNIRFSESRWIEGLGGPEGLTTSTARQITSVSNTVYATISFSASDVGAVLSVHQNVLSVGSYRTIILYYMKDTSVIGGALERAVSTAAAVNIAVNHGTFIGQRTLVVDTSSGGSPFLGIVTHNSTGGRIYWMRGSSGNLSNLTGSALSQYDIGVLSLDAAKNAVAGFIERKNSGSRLVVIIGNRILHHALGENSLTQLSISDSDWLSIGAADRVKAFMYTQGSGSPVVAVAISGSVYFFAVEISGGVPTGVRKIGLYLYNSTFQIRSLKAWGHRLGLQFSVNSSRPIHHIIELGDSGVVTLVDGELKGSAIMYAEPAPLRNSMHSASNPPAHPPFIYYQNSGDATTVFPTSGGGQGSGTDNSERIGAFASMPTEFSAGSGNGVRMFVENSNKKFRIYELDGGELQIIKEFVNPVLQSCAPGFENDRMSFFSYRSLAKMPRLAPWGCCYSAITGVLGRSASGSVQRAIMVGSVPCSLDSSNNITTSSALKVPLTQPIVWVSHINVRSSTLSASPSVLQVARSETTPGQKPYKKVVVRYVVDSTIDVPVGSSTPISTQASGQQIQPFLFWGRWLFPVNISTSNVGFGTPVQVPDVSGSSYPFEKWFHSTQGSGSDGYSDFLDGYVTSVSSGNFLVVANSRCIHMRDTEPDRMEVRVFRFQSSAWSQVASIRLDDPFVMGPDLTGTKYDPDSYLPQRISLAISSDGKVLAVAGHRWGVSPSGIPKNNSVDVFNLNNTSTSLKLTITAPEGVSGFADWLQVRHEGGSIYKLYASSPLASRSGGTNVSSMAAENNILSFTIDTQGAAARISECNDLVPVGETGFVNSAAANLNHWVASPSPAYNGSQSLSWTGSKLTMTTLNRLISVQSDKFGWKVTDHVSRPFKYTGARVLAKDFGTYQQTVSCSPSSTVCTQNTVALQLPMPAGGNALLDGRVRNSFFVPQTVSANMDAGFYQVDCSSGSGWWSGVSGLPNLPGRPEMSHINSLNSVPRTATPGGYGAVWNPSVAGVIRRVTLSGSGAGGFSSISGSSPLTTRRPILAQRLGQNTMTWPYLGSLDVVPKHILRYTVSDQDSIRKTVPNNLDLVDAGAIALTRNASAIIALKDGMDRSSISGEVVGHVSPQNWGVDSGLAEPVGQLVSFKIANNSMQIGGFTRGAIFPEEDVGARVSGASQRFGIKRPMAITVGGDSVCGAGSADLARPARSPLVPLEGRLSGARQKWLMLIERHGMLSDYSHYSGNFGSRGLSVSESFLRMADLFKVDLQAPFAPVGHQDRMDWCSGVHYPISGQKNKVYEAITDMMRGVLDPDNGSVFNGDVIGFGTTDGYADISPPNYLWAYPPPEGGAGTTVRCLCKSTLIEAYGWLSRVVNMPIPNLNSTNTALRVLYGPDDEQQTAAPFLTRFNEGGNKLTSLIFILTVGELDGLSSISGTPLGDTSEQARRSWSSQLANSLRSADIIEADGSIHFIDMVKRGLSSPYRRACETLAEVTGGSYISLGRPRLSP